MLSALQYAGHILPGHQSALRASLRIDTAIDDMIADVLRQARISQFCRQVPKLLEEITGCGGAGFDFNGVQIFAPVNE